MSANIHYVSLLVHHPSDHTTVEARLDWLSALLKAKLPLTLFIDSMYYNALSSSDIYKDLIHDDLELVMWNIEESNTWNKCLSYGPMGSFKLPPQRNLEKDCEFFMVIMNAKTELVARVAKQTAKPYIAYIDAGIKKIFRDVEGSFDRLKHMELCSDISGMIIPGCWDKDCFTIEQLCYKIFWVYCGGFFVISSKEAESLYVYTQKALEEFLKVGFITWEVNVWIRLITYEDAPKINWFRAGHDDTMIMIPTQYIVQADKN
jgi:hypothetical protein